MNIGDTVTATIKVPADVKPDDITVRFIRPDGSEAMVRTLTGGGVTLKTLGDATKKLPTVYIATYNADVAGTWKARGRVVSGGVQSNPVDEFYINRG